nr:MAG TPA: hypothetical protein [Caudoviricetes sp.]
MSLPLSLFVVILYHNLMCLSIGKIHKYNIRILSTLPIDNLPIGIFLSR